MKNVTLMALLCLVWACGTGNDADAPEPHGDVEMGSAAGKADDAKQTESTSLADEFDYCGTFELYDDGTCHDFCWEIDPDCVGVEQQDEAIESESDSDCDASDCGADDEVEELLSDEEIEGVCRRFRNTDGRTRDLAETLCMQREDDEEAFENCVNNCLDAYANR